MKKAEYSGSGGFLQKDSAEHEGYAEALNTETREAKEADGADERLAHAGYRSILGMYESVHLCG